ncbi:MAG: hypothetical protein GY737_00370 [Desulfobacteraceae bacterium]|nr:hypothetical protein [Desulfobacteraceae bacterium]
MRNKPQELFKQLKMFTTRLRRRVRRPKHLSLLHPRQHPPNLSTNLLLALLTVFKELQLALPEKPLQALFRAVKQRAELWQPEKVLWLPALLALRLPLLLQPLALLLPVRAFLLVVQAQLGQLEQGRRVLLELLEQPQQLEQLRLWLKAVSQPSYLS